MEPESSVIYGLEFPSRAMAPQRAETEVVRFFVGTQSLRENQIHLLDYDEDANVVHKTVFPHDDGEIWILSPSPTRAQLLVAVCDRVVEGRVESKATVYRVPGGSGHGADGEAEDTLNDDDSFSDRGAGLQRLVDLDAAVSFGSTVSAALWHPAGDEKMVALVDDRVVLLDVAVASAASASASAASSGRLEGRGQIKFAAGKWNPHHNSTQVATANDAHLRGWDLRSMKQSYAIENAHAQPIRDLDFNPNKQYVLASCGDDCRVKFWDVRKTDAPLMTVAEHSHWVWAVKYNCFHDQLLLTSSSDSRVILHNASSVSSEPAGSASSDIDDDSNDPDDSFDASGKSSDPLEDGVVSTFEEHEDSVYAVEWSVADPWIFASLSYDGRLVINRVPRSVKYRILL